MPVPLRTCPAWRRAAKPSASTKRAPSDTWIVAAVMGERLAHEMGDRPSLARSEHAHLAPRHPRGAGGRLDADVADPRQRLRRPGVGPLPAGSPPAEGR